jgi:hypothetical protein
MKELIPQSSKVVVRSVLRFITVSLLIPQLAAQTLSYTGGTILQNFDSIGSAGTNTPTGWLVGWAGGSVTFTTNVSLNDGSIGPNQTAGWNFGASGAGDRALGLMASSTGTPTPPGNDRLVEVRIQNNSGQPIGAINVRYDGEEWRTGSSATQINTNKLQFSADGVNFVSMGTNFQFVQPVLSPISTALDGKAAANRRTNIGGIYLLPTTINVGSLIYLRWYDVNDPSSDPGLAMDNFLFSATNALIAITNQPKTQIVAPGTNISLTVTAGPAISWYQWQRDGVALTNSARIQGVNTSMLTISNVEPVDLGVYTVTVSNAVASLGSEPATILFAAPAFHWARRAGAGGSTADFGDAIACDGGTALYVSGQYLSGADFNGTTLTGSGLFLARYTAAGELEWVRSATSATGAPVGHSVSVDPLGNCYLTGSFDGTTTFGTTNLSSAGGSDVFVAKYDRSGTLLWVARQGGAFDDSGRGVAADNTNGCVVTGLLQSSSGSVSRDILVARYTANGVLQWQRQPSSSSSDAGMAVATDPNGNAYVTGWFTGTATFLSTNITAVGSRDIFVAKYNNAGTLLWVSVIGDASADEGKGIGIDTNGNAYVAGSFNIGGGNTSNDAEKLLLTKLSSSGSMLWQRELPVSFWYFDFSGATDRAGNTWVAGGMRGNGNLNGVPVTSTGSYDGLIAKYDSAGTLVWFSQITGTGSTIAHRVAPDNFGRCYVTGEFDNTAGFNTTNLTSAGGTDVFVSRIGTEVPEPIRLSVHRTGGVAIGIAGSIGSIVQLQAATTLTNGPWGQITNVMLTTNTVMVSQPTNEVQKFYRALALP